MKRKKKKKNATILGQLTKILSKFTSNKSGSDVAPEIAFWEPRDSINRVKRNRTFANPRPVKFATSNFVFITVLSASRRCPRLVLWFYVRRHLLPASITRRGNGNSSAGGWIAREESGREMKLPVERIYSTNWWNRTDGYSTVHFAVLASFWRVASDERVPLVISPKPLDIHLIPDVNACMYIGCICSPTLCFRRWIVDEKFSLHRWKPLGSGFLSTLEIRMELIDISFSFLFLLNIRKIILVNST